MKLIRIIFLIISVCICLISQTDARKSAKHLEEERFGSVVSHQAFNGILQKYVSSAGNVNYKHLLKDSTSLSQYLKNLSNNPPATNWSRDEKLAYWINAYNGFTLQLILRHYPVKSIKDIGSKIKIPFVNTPWDAKFIRIGKNYVDLNHIEHGILRKQFSEPRIHFAIVCASVSCPKLLNEAYTPEKLNQQLNEQASNFINDPSRNKITPNAIRLSKIFSWFKGDFTKKGSLINFLNQYSKIKINPNASFSTLDYNWNLNE